MSIRTITAMFDSADDAQRAQDNLLSLGVGAGDVRVIDQAERSADGDESDKSFWESIKDFFVADNDRAAYTEGVRRGGYLLTARIEEEYADVACEILESCNAVDLDARAQQWRTEGWTDAPAAATVDDEERDINAGTSEEVIPVVRERLRVGKRDVKRGSVRVRSYVVEEPVEEDVQLREEHVEVERRPVKLRAQAADELLQDRTIEVTETAEEPVVAKTAEVTEEVVVRKIEAQRTEGVSDTIRRTEVDVEDSRDEGGRDDDTDEVTRPPPDLQKRSRTPGEKPRAR
jgi:uncharacterized protein (TIGR02271 family)